MNLRLWLPLALLFSLFVTPSLHADDAFARNVDVRDGLPNCRLVFMNQKKGTVAFLGGSITEMEGYRPMVCDMLTKRFPQTQFKFINAGVSSTSSTTGAFRLVHDVFGDAVAGDGAENKVDLLFVEFAVNDDQDAHHTREECIRGIEGIVRHARQLNPNIDIVITYFVNEGMLDTLQHGHTPLTIEAHAKVAEHYGIPTINLARQVAGEITAGSLTWEKYGGVHPAPFGNAICAKMIDSLFDQTWSRPPVPDLDVMPHAKVEPLDPLSYERGRFVDLKQATLGKGWTIDIPEWSKLPSGKRDRFEKIPILEAAEPGAQLTLKFEGTAVGAYVLAGPDAGELEASIDEGPFAQVNLLHAFSAGLHYPRTVMFAEELKPGPHTLTLKVSTETKGTGHAARIMQFVAN